MMFFERGFLNDREESCARHPVVYPKQNAKSMELNNFLFQRGKKTAFSISIMRRKRMDNNSGLGLPHNFIVFCDEHGFCFFWTRYRYEQNSQPDQTVSRTKHTLGPINSHTQETTSQKKQSRETEQCTLHNQRHGGSPRKCSLLHGHTRFPKPRFHPDCPSQKSQLNARLKLWAVE